MFSIKVSKQEDHIFDYLSELKYQWIVEARFRRDFNAYLGQ